MTEIMKYDEQIQDLANFIKVRKINIETPEKLKEAMQSWLKEGQKFYASLSNKD